MRKSNEKKQDSIATQGLLNQLSEKPGFPEKNFTAYLSKKEMTKGKKIFSSDGSNLFVITLTDKQLKKYSHLIFFNSKSEAGSLKLDTLQNERYYPVVVFDKKGFVSFTTKANETS
ncbi:MAG: hypothetical protein LBS52_07985 [Dysgonamonadaceae bacterium]|nr:hypothetical protein [Dysgonamonadaceae bacterium]